jgi:surface protein
MLFWAVTSFAYEISCLLNVIGLSFLATVFYHASAFNGDLNQWDVAKVTDMTSSKSIRILT